MFYRRVLRLPLSSEGTILLDENTDRCPENLVYRKCVQLLSLVRQPLQITSVWVDRWRGHNPNHTDTKATIQLRYGGFRIYCERQ